MLVTGCQIHDGLVVQLSLVEVVEREIDLAQIQAGLQQRGVEPNGLFELRDGGVAFHCHRILQSTDLRRGGPLGLRFMSLLVELLAPPQQYAAEVVVRPRRNGLQLHCLVQMPFGPVEIARLRVAIAQVAVDVGGRGPRRDAVDPLRGGVVLEGRRFGPLAFRRFLVVLGLRLGRDGVVLLRLFQR